MQHQRYYLIALRNDVFQCTAGIVSIATILAHAIRRLKVALPRKDLARKLNAPDDAPTRQGDGGIFLSDTMMLVLKAMKTIPVEYWTSRPSLRIAPVNTS